MITPPRALAPWQAALDLFDAEIAGALGPLLPALSLALGPMRASRPEGGGDPDGFSGVARRGSYERLLLTEWLLADEAPLEFARRAAAGEHAFLQIARRAPTRAMTSVALFDAGPDGLGDPRVAHLALLLVLAARAERAGARFAWGLLHQPEAALFPAVTKESVMSLLAGRTAIAPTSSDVAAWIDRAAASRWEDAWIVGAGAHLPTWKHGLVTVRDPLDPARRALSVTVRAPSRPAREIELDLPPGRVTARLLREPFAPTPAPTVRPPPEPEKPAAKAVPCSNLVFAPNGAKLFARAESGEIIAYPVPSSASAGHGRPKRYRSRAEGVIAAVGWVDRAIVTLVVKGRELVVEHCSRHRSDLLERSIPLPDGLDLTPPTTTHHPLSLLSFRVTAAHEQLFFTDAHRALFRVRVGVGDGVADVAFVAGEVSAMAEVGGVLSCVARHLEGEPGFRLMIREDEPLDLRLAGDGTFEACFGSVRHGARPLCAVQQRADLWSVYQRLHAIAERLAPAGTRVIGAWRAGPASPAMLVLLESDQRTISLVSGHAARSLPRVAAPIVETAMSNASPVIAYLTTAGEVGLYALDRNEELARFPVESIR